MGFLDWIGDKVKGAASGVLQVAKKLGGTIKEGLKNAGKYVEEKVAPVVGKAVTTVYNDAKSVAGYVGDRYAQAETGVFGLANKTIDSITGILGNPLLWVAGGIGIYLVYSATKSTASNPDVQRAAMMAA